MNYVFDTSAVIILIEICRLSKELSKFSQDHGLYVPNRVKEEFLDGSVSPSDVSAFEEVFSVVAVELEEELLPFFDFDQSDGAIWVISYACKNPDCYCVIDEEFGRKISNLFGVKLTGTIGIILKMKEAGILSSISISEIKDKIKNSRFYYTDKLLAELDGHDK